MTTITWNNITFPANPSPKYVYVSNISATATEEKVKEFFLFCGKFAQFELQKSGETQVCLIQFEKESAAKTATMLSNAVIADAQINVQYYYEQFSSTGHKEAEAAAAVDAQTASSDSQEAKPKSGIVVEVIAAGYKLSEVIVERARVFDAQYGVSAHLQSYYQQALAQLQTFDEKYAVKKTLTDRAAEVDAKFSVSQHVAGVMGQVQAGVQNVLATAPGQRATEIYNQTVAQVGSALEQGKHRVEEEKAATHPTDAAPATDAATPAPEAS